MNSTYIEFYGHLVMWQGLLGITKTEDFKWLYSIYHQCSTLNLMTSMSLSFAIFVFVQWLVKVLYHWTDRRNDGNIVHGVDRRVFSRVKFAVKHEAAKLDKLFIDIFNFLI